VRLMKRSSAITWLERHWTKLAQSYELLERVSTLTISDRCPRLRNES
jgi:hypothetical protein